MENKLDSSNLTLCYDVEANGLLYTAPRQEVTKLWCVCAIDYYTDEVWLFHDFPQLNGSMGEVEEKYKEKGVVGFQKRMRKFVIPKRSGTLAEGVAFLYNAKSIICHNQLSYDQPAMIKFFPKEFKSFKYAYPEIRDTLLESQMFNFNRRAVKGYKGIHGLEPWGGRMGIYKPPIQDWTKMDKFMLDRCIEDVKINKMVAKQLDKERELLLEQTGLDFQVGMEKEQEFKYAIAHQEFWGAKVDIPHVKKCLTYLDERCKVLADEVEPQLPPVIKPHGSSKMTYVDVCKAMGVTSLPDVPKPLHSEIKWVVDRFKYNIWKKEKDITYKKEANKFFGHVTANYLKYEKYRIYSAVNKDGNSVDKEFSNIKEARDWVKTHHENTKGWKYPFIEKKRPLLNHHTCNWFDCEETDTHLIGGAFTKISITPSTLNQDDVVKSFLLKLGWKPQEWTYKKDKHKNVILDIDEGKDIKKAMYSTFKTVCDVSQFKDKTEENQAYFQWLEDCNIDASMLVPIPKSPKLTEKSFKSLPEGLGAMIAEYNTLSHRRGYLANIKDDTKGVLNNIRKDGRITCGVNSFGTISGRQSQYGIVNLPNPKAVFGKEMRASMVASEGNVLLGVDQASAHPRILSYLTGNEKFLEAVNSGKETDEDDNFLGTDFHTVNAQLFSLVTEEEVEKARKEQVKEVIEYVQKQRGIGKGLSYLCLYGGSGTKLAKELGVSIEEGEQRKKDFLEGLGLDILLDDLNQQWKDHANPHKNGRGAYIKVCGDYYILCESKHKLINTLAIGSEAVLQKTAIILLIKEIKKRKSKAKLISNFHDEILLDCPKDEVSYWKPFLNDFYETSAQMIGIDNNFYSTTKEGIDYSKVH